MLYAWPIPLTEAGSVTDLLLRWHAGEEEAIQRGLWLMSGPGSEADLSDPGGSPGSRVSTVDLSLAALTAAAPEHIGPYRILETLGRGGMGSVYLAERDDEHYRQQVAIKVMRHGLDNPEVLRRLRQERQILAHLDHPNIARLLDGGNTPEGLPYFVMELVEGEPIHEYCDHDRLPIRGRLELFLKVCSAVQYAHRNLVVHRDLKPSNILVTEDGTPKLLDFGIAKLLDPELADDQFMPTLPGMRLLTPQYASPEQIRGEPLDIASDVYSLGVVLYELLSGQRPHHSSRRAELERRVCEVEPPPPSEAALTAGAAGGGEVTPQAVGTARAGTLERLRRRLQGDLDTVVLKALHKEPARRYASVSHFADDLRRHLNGLPVSARRDTLAYRGRKFIARHGVAVAGRGLRCMAVPFIRFPESAARLIGERFRAVDLLLRRLLADSLKFSRSEPESSWRVPNPYCVFSVREIRLVANRWGRIPAPRSPGDSNARSANSQPAAVPGRLHGRVVVPRSRFIGAGLRAVVRRPVGMGFFGR